MNRRHFLKSALISGCSAGSVARCLAGEASSSESEKLILSTPLTHSDWMLKAGIPWGEAGVRHMLDACKACGWSRVYWRALDGGRSLYKSRLMRAAKTDGTMTVIGNPQSDASTNRQLSERFSPSTTPDQRAVLLQKFAALDYAHFDSLWRRSAVWT